MSRAIAVLRPEPGNRVTAAAIEGRGRVALRMPLFEIRPLAWEVPDAAAFDALILTSANALRHGGAGLAALHRLPVYAVGKATAEAASQSGFEVRLIGEQGAAALVASAQASGVRHALHLAGRERSIEAGGIVAEVIAAYASDRRMPDEVMRLAGSVALVHSARSGAWLGELADARHLDRSGIALVAVSIAAAAAAGPGWERITVPGLTNDALIDAAIALAD